MSSDTVDGYIIWNSNCSFFSKFLFYYEMISL